MEKTKNLVAKWIRVDWLEDDLVLAHDEVTYVVI